MDVTIWGLTQKVPSRLKGKETCLYWVGYVHSHEKFRGRFPHPEDVDFSQEPMCLLLPWVRKHYHNNGDLQGLLEPTPPRLLKQERPGAGVGGQCGELGTISTSECPWNSLRLAQFFQKGKVKTVLYWDFFQRSSQIILQWCFGEIDFSCVCFSKIALALGEVFYQPPNGPSNWRYTCDSIKEAWVFPWNIHFLSGLIIGDYLEH